MSAAEMCNKERLVAYVYEEDGPAERHAMEAHLATCAACAREVHAFRGVREHLARWEAPEVDLGFRITREPLGVSHRRALWPLPAWAQAVAAVLLLVVGAALANVDVQYGGFAVRIGWEREADRNVSPAAAPAPVATSAAAAAKSERSEVAWRADLDHLAQELRAELRAASTDGEAGAARPDRDTIVAQVRGLIAESERRQQRELALRLTQVMHDMERQRRADLVRIEQNFGQLEGFTGAEAARQRELLNYLVRVSQQR